MTQSDHLATVLGALARAGRATRERLTTVVWAQDHQQAPAYGTPPWSDPEHDVVGDFRRVTQQAFDSWGRRGREGVYWEPAPEDPYGTPITGALLGHLSHLLVEHYDGLPPNQRVRLSWDDDWLRIAAEQWAHDGVEGAEAFLIALQTWRRIDVWRYVP